MTGPCNEALYHVPFDKAGMIIGKGLLTCFLALLSTLLFEPL